MGFLKPVKRWANRKGPLNEEPTFSNVPLELEADSPPSTLDLSPTDIRPVGQRLSTVAEVDDEGSPQRPSRRPAGRANNHESTRRPVTRSRTHAAGQETRIPNHRPKVQSRPSSNGSGPDFSDMHSLLAVDRRSPRSQLPRTSPSKVRRPLPDVPKPEPITGARVQAKSGAPRVDLRASLLVENKQTAERVKALALASLEEQEDDPFVTNGSQNSPSERRQSSIQQTPTKRKRASKRSSKSSKVNINGSFRAPKFTTPETEPSFTSFGSKSRGSLAGDRSSGSTSSGSLPGDRSSESRIEQIERRRKELTVLDEQIRQVGVRLWRLEAISQRVRTLPSVPEMSAVDKRSPISRKDSLIDLNSSGKKTSPSNQALMSSSQKTETTMKTASTPMSRYSGRCSTAISEYTVASSIDLDDYEELDDCDTVLQTRSTRSSSCLRKSSQFRPTEPAQTGLATKMSYVRQAPAVVQMRRQQSPRRSYTRPPMPPIPAEHLQVRHKTMPSGYSFITFKSIGKGAESEYAESVIPEEEYSDRTSMLSASSQSLVSRRQSMNHAFSAFGIRPVSPSTIGTHEDGPTTPNFSLFPSVKQPNSNAMNSNNTRRSSGAYPTFGNQAWPLRSFTDLEFIPTTPTPLGRRKTPRHASRRRVHVRTESRALGGSVRAAGHAKLMIHDMKRWFLRGPKRLTRGNKQNRRSMCPPNTYSSRALALA